MKKLMMFAAAMTIVGGAFAQALGTGPEVYDYKASVKNVNLKSITVRLNGAATSVLVKFVETSSLYGYVVQNCDECGGAPAPDLGALIVANKKYKQPKILWSSLQARIWNPKIVANKTWEAEGYLWAQGSDMSTAFLFGMWNDAEDTDADGVQDFFSDTWLDAAGFGKARNASTDGGCGVGTTCAGLDTLAGSTIGGLFLCHPNGYNLTDLVRDAFICNGWLNGQDVISGTWSIKRNLKLVGKAFVAADGYTTANTLEVSLDPMVNAAIKAISPTTAWSTVVSDDFAAWWLL